MGTCCSINSCKFSKNGTQPIVLLKEEEDIESDTIKNKNSNKNTRENTKLKIDLEEKPSEKALNSLIVNSEQEKMFENKIPLINKRLQQIKVESSLTRIETPSSRQSVLEGSIPRQLWEEITPQLENRDSLASFESIEERQVNQEERAKRKHNFIQQPIKKKFSIENSENFEIIRKERKPTNIIFLINAMKMHFLFSNFDDIELYCFILIIREEIVEKMFYCSIENEKVLFKQGDDAYSFFIIEKGELFVMINDKLIRDLKSGDYFGELALLYNAPRSATIIAKSKTFMWAIDRESFQNAVKELSKKKYEENQFFTNLTSEQKDVLSYALTQQKFIKEQVIIREGDQATSFYIVMEGSVEARKCDGSTKIIKFGESFGETALYSINAIRKMTVVAKTDCILLALGKKDVKCILGEQIQVIFYKNMLRWAYEKDPIMKRLTKIQQEKLIDSMNITNQEKFCVVVNKDEFSPKIVVPLEGSLKQIFSQKKIVDNGVLWGSEYVHNTNLKLDLSENLALSIKGVIAEINLEKIEQILGGNLSDIIKINEKTLEVFNKNIFKEKNNKTKINS